MDRIKRKSVYQVIPNQENKTRKVGRPKKSDRVQSPAREVYITEEQRLKKEKRKQNFQNYSKESLDEALLKIKNKEMSLSAAAKKYGIPKSTLGDKKNNLHPKKFGRPTALCQEIEDQLVVGLKIAGDWGFPLGKEQICKVVHDLLSDNDIIIPQFTNNVPGEGWVNNFMTRHPDIALRNAKNIRRSHAKVSPTTIQNYFDELGVTITGIPLENIFNCDESYLTDNGKKQFKFFRKGIAHAEEVSDHTKSSISFMLCGSATGDILPLYIVYKNEASEVRQDWEIGGPIGEPFCPCCKHGIIYDRSTSGWFDAPNFKNWFHECFLPHARKLSGKKVLLLNSLVSHFSIKVLAECTKHNIQMVPLPPNSTHLCQPLDCAFFGPLKRVWKNYVTHWRDKNPSDSPLDKHLFPGIVKAVFNIEEPHVWQNNMRSGFRSCGIFSSNPQQVLKRIPQTKNQQHRGCIPEIHNVSASASSNNDHRVPLEVLTQPMNSAFAKQLEQQRGFTIERINCGLTKANLVGDEVKIKHAKCRGKDGLNIVADNENETEDILSNNEEQLQEDDDVVIKTEEFEDDEEIGSTPTRSDQNVPSIAEDENYKSWMVFIEEEEDSDIKDEQMEDQQQNSSLMINSPDRNDELLDYFSSNYDEQTDEESDVEEIDALTKASYEIPDDLQNLLNKNESGVSKTDINRRWAKTEMASSLFPFSVHRGPNKSSFANYNNPMDFFLQFFDDSIIKHICFQSNFYAAQKSIVLDLHKEEFLAFLGINMVMSYVKQPSDYWSEDVDFKQDFISSHMSKDRFMTILYNLHLNDNSTISNHKGEKLYKIEPFVSKLKERFKNLYFPEREISVDGFTIPSKGESSINPLKPGYRMWCLGDSSGYVSNFDIFSSRQLQEINKNRNIYGLGGSIVLDLSKDYLGKGYRLFFDEFFSSFQLLERLKLEHTYACGTIGGNGNDFPLLDPDDSLHRGEFDYRSTINGITVYKWKDVKSIHLISNYHGIKEATVARKRKSGVKEAVPCPEVVLDYNQYTVGIDKRNSFQSSYGTNRNNMDWWHHLFFYLVDVTVINSYVVYCQTKHCIPFIDFKRQLSVSLVNKVKISKCNKKRKGNN